MKKVIIIIGVIAALILAYTLFIEVPFSRTVEYTKLCDATLQSISEDGGTDNYHVDKGYRVVSYSPSDLTKGKSTVMESNFLKENGLLDLKSGDKVLLVRKTTYYRPGILKALLYTFIEYIDVYNSSNEVNVPFKKTVYSQKDIILPVNNKYNVK